MIPFEASLLVAFTIVYAHTSGLYLVAFSRRRVEPEFKYFGYLCAVLALLAFGRTLPLAAELEEMRLPGATLMMIGHCALVPPFVAFCETLTGHRTRLFPGSIGFTVLGYLIVGLGLHLSRDEAGALSGLSSFATLYCAFGALIAFYALSKLARAGTDDPEIKRIVIASAICLVALLFDSIMGSHELHRVQLLPHLGIFALGFVHWMLLERFRSATETLRDRREAYATSLEQLIAKEKQLRETEQLAAIGELSAVIAHEVRNPLAVIKNISSGLRRQFDNFNTRMRLVDILDEEAMRLQRLSFQLENFATHSAIEPGVIELSSLIDGAIRRALSEYEDEPSFEIVTRVEPGAERCLGDAIHLETALIFLIQNAIDAIDAKGDFDGINRLEIIAALKDAPETLSLSVIDTGDGMDEETLKKAAAPFFTTKPRGSGLALTIVDRVAKNHQGRLELESELGRGTRAELLIPQSAMRRHLREHTPADGEGDESSRDEATR